MIDGLTPDESAPEQKGDVSRSSNRSLRKRLSFSLITSSAPNRLTKKFDLIGGKLVKEASGKLTSGTVARIEVDDLIHLNSILDGLKQNQAAAWGLTGYDEVPLVTEKNLPADGSAIARTRQFFSFAASPGVLMLDHDGSQNEILDADSFHSRLVSAVPALADAPMLIRPSASAGIATSSGDPLTNVGKLRIYIPVTDARSIPTAGKLIVGLLWASGLNWFDVGSAGQALERGLVDSSVWQPERLDFAAAPVLGEGLTRIAAPFKTFGDVSGLFDTSLIAMDTKQRELANERRGQAKKSVREECRVHRKRWAAAKAPELAATRNITTEKALAILLRASEYRVLTGEFVLHAEDGSDVTVNEILDRQEHWHGKRFADPLGDYPLDDRIATADLKNGLRAYLRSFGHGGETFELRRQSSRVQIGRGLRIETTDATLAVLRDRGELFDFGEGAIAYVAEGKARSVGRDWLTDHMGRNIEYFSVKTTWEADGTVKTVQERAEDAPPIVASTIIAKNGERGFKKLTAVITAPTLRSDGSLLNTAGYDEASKLLYFREKAHPFELPLDPSPDDALLALQYLWAPFALFPLVDKISRGVVLQAILTACLRPSLPTAIGTGFDAPAPGTGKTLLARCIGVLATGTDPSILPPSDTDEETRKRLFAALRDGARVLLWDNIREPLGTASLDAFLTASTFTDRVLGESVIATLPNRALFLATGNNLRITSDTCRRILVAKLDAGMERAYTREFDFDPAERLLNDRFAFVAAALTIVRAWITGGRPRLGKGRTASFESWDDMVRQPICWIVSLMSHHKSLGQLPEFDDPIKATDASFEQDPETAKLAGLLHAWHAVFGSEPITVKMLVDRLAFNPELNDAIEEIALVNQSINRRMLGKWIERRAGQILGSKQIVRTGDARTGVALWAVRKIVA